MKSIAIRLLSAVCLIAALGPPVPARRQHQLFPHGSCGGSDRRRHSIAGHHNIRDRMYLGFPSIRTQGSNRWSPSIGLRWELQLPLVPLNDVYTYNTLEDLRGISGYGNLFKPGVMTGQEPTHKQLEKGPRVFNVDYRAFAPSFGFAWSPRAGGGWLGRLLGSGGQTIVRGGYSTSYNRNKT